MGRVSEAPDIRGFQPDGIMGSIPSKPLSSVGPVESLFRVSQGRPHSTPGSGVQDISCVLELPLHRGTKFQRPSCGGSLAHLRVRGLLSAWPATASHPLGHKSSADRPGPRKSRAEAISWECHPPQWPAFLTASLLLLRLPERPPVTSCPQPKDPQGRKWESSP